MRSLEMAGAASISARIKPGGLMAAVALIACRSLYGLSCCCRPERVPMGDVGVALGDRPKIHSMSSSRREETMCRESS